MNDNHNHTISRTRTNTIYVYEYILEDNKRGTQHTRHTNTHEQYSNDTAFTQSSQHPTGRKMCQQNLPYQRLPL